MTGQEILDALRCSAPSPPPVNWAAYRVELRERIATHRPVRRWWRRPFPVAGVAVAATAVLLLLIADVRPPAEPPMAIITDEVLVSGRLDLFQHLRIIERLDLFEDLDVLRLLDQAPPGPRS